MALGVGVEVIRKRSFQKFNFDSARFVKEACAIIKNDIQEGIVDKVQIDGSPMPALAPITIKMKSGGFGISRGKIGKELKGVRDIKQRRAGVAVDPSHPLIFTGNLYKNQVVKTNGNIGTIEVGSTRKEIAQELQLHGVGKSRKTFYFFGISERAVEKIRALLRIRWGESFEVKRG